MHFLAEADLPPNPTESISSWHFCDNEPDADGCAELVVRGIKRATSPSLWWIAATDSPLPTPGDHHVVTNWAGEAQCVIRTERVDIVPFDQVGAEYAATEGEGDGSLEYWRRVHWAYYQRELEGTEFTPTLDMPVVCERFSVVFPRTAARTSPRES